MVWLIVVSAIVVLGLAAVAGTGRFGEMPEVVTDRPRALLPDPPFGAEYLSSLRLPRVSTGYEPTQVDEFLTAAAAGTVDREEPMFDVVPGGYDMQATDLVVEVAMRTLTRPPLATEEPQESAIVSAEQPTVGDGTAATPRRGVGDPDDAE